MPVSKNGIVNDANLKSNPEIPNPCNRPDRNYAPVICIPGSPGAGDSGDIAGLKCLALTSDVSRQCRGFAGVMIH